MASYRICEGGVELGAIEADSLASALDIACAQERNWHDYCEFADDINIEPTCAEVYVWGDDDEGLSRWVIVEAPEMGDRWESYEVDVYSGTGQWIGSATAWWVAS